MFIRPVRTRSLTRASPRTHSGSPGTLSVTGLDAEIRVASIDTAVAQRDAHLRAPAFFDADVHPTMEFRSREAGRSAPKAY
jgi:polyisoprenoid-binding protein YceI